MEKTVRERYFKGDSLSVIPKKEKSKLEVLNEIIKLFEKNHKYDEKEINEILKSIYPDFAILRRYLVDYGYLKRNKECSEYSVNER
ncbi:DUF2087 domain-containing protein [Viridibacillus sp. NPDC096237]|uniref:DUF2087 domain-containing protein n=1 Tax=Viridibacillus sp. NPDC096237 TaxID=3390721 RepID=UPI003CFDBCAE